MIPPSNQDGDQAKNRKKEDEFLKILSSETTKTVLAKLKQMAIRWSFSKLYPITPIFDLYGRQAKR